MKRRILLTGFALAPALTLLGCSKSAETGNGYKEIKLGTLSGPHAEIAEVAVKLAAKDGLKVKIVEFSDYGHLNEALSTGDIDCNAFQHKPFLDKATNLLRSVRPSSSRSASTPQRSGARKTSPTACLFQCRLTPSI